MNRAEIGIGVTFGFVPAAGVTLHVARAGPEDGPLVILLHGFPEFWYGWRRQIPTLAAAGYRVWAPDQRGYNLSDKPEQIGDYRVSRLVEGVIARIAAAGRRDAVLVGHDWGAVVAWATAMAHPERVARLAVLNAPHPTVTARAMRNGWSQRRKSRYMVFFQLPRVPEWLLGRDGFRPARRALVASGLPGTFDQEDLDRYREAWSQPGAPRAMLDWYRVAFRRPPRAVARPRTVTLRVPMSTLILWGEHDVFLGRELAAPSLEFCMQGKLHSVDASHWLQHDRSAEVNALLLEFLAAG